MTTMGKVYFVECAGRIKIGYTADVALRLKALSTGSAHDLHLLCSINGSVHLERAIHQHLKVHRIRGEWFADCSDVRTVMQTLLDRGPGAIGFVEPPTGANLAPIHHFEPAVPPLRPWIGRLNACMDRYVGEHIATAREREVAMEMETGTLINPLIGGFYSNERAVSACAMIRSAIDSMEQISDVIVSGLWRGKPVDQQPFVEPMSNIASQLESGLQKLFADPVPTLIAT